MLTFGNKSGREDDGWDELGDFFDKSEYVRPVLVNFMREGILGVRTESDKFCVLHAT